MDELRRNFGCLRMLSRQKSFAAVTFCSSSVTRCNPSPALPARLATARIFCGCCILWQFCCIVWHLSTSPLQPARTRPPHECTIRFGKVKEATEEVLRNLCWPRMLGLPAVAASHGHAKPWTTGLDRPTAPLAPRTPDSQPQEYTIRMNTLQAAAPAGGGNL